MSKWININLHTDLIKYITDPQEHTTNDTRRAKNEFINQGVKTAGVKYYNIHRESILFNICTESDIYDNYSYVSCVNWEIEQALGTHPKQIEFNIDKPETALKRIDFNINTIDDEINDINKEKVAHPRDGLTNDNYSNIEDHEIQQEQTNQIIVFTLLLITNYN